jgi:EAL domain-containing protein (putative c-di-GMP-specific phosphodiesterase class I)
VDLLVTIGVAIPDLSERAIAGGLSPSAVRRLDDALVRGQRRDLLADLVIGEHTGRIVYSGLDSAAGTRPRREPELAAALSGRSVTRTHASELDPISGTHSGVLDGFKPLVDKTGRVYGAMEVSLPLKRIEAVAGRVQRRTTAFLLGGAALVWLLLMPLLVRLARSQAKDWVPGRHRIRRAFRRALARGEIELVYQPQIDLRTRRVDGVEALVRWRRKGALVGPDHFLAAVEPTALMARLTDRVLDLALAQVAGWRRAGLVVRVAVNLSPTDLADKTLPLRIAEKLKHHGVMGPGLTLEVTETAILEDAEQARLVLAVLDQMGIDIAVDDFGTGHSSISRLHGLPVSEVKIDRSFVSDTEERSRIYMAAMVSFGRGLGLRVVAEGVEDPETLAVLTTLECDLAQGYLISAPLEAAAMTVWLTEAGSGRDQPALTAPPNAALTTAWAAGP